MKSYLLDKLNEIMRYSVEGLSTRARKVLEENSLDDLKAIYASKGSFLDFKNVGVNANKELVYLISTLEFQGIMNAADITRHREKLEIVLSNIDRLQYNYNILKCEVSKDELKFLDDLELEYGYEQLKIVNVFYFYELLFQDSDKFVAKSKRYYDFYLPNYLDFIRVYLLKKTEEIGSRLRDVSLMFEDLKGMLTKRSQNILSDIQSHPDISIDSFDKDYWVKFITDPKLDFVKIRNCGKKSVLELTTLRELVSLVLKAGEEAIKPRFSSTGVIKENNVEDMVFKEFPFLKASDIDNICKNERIDLFVLANLVFLNRVLKPLARRVVSAYFFDSNLMSLREIAEGVNCSHERVRQIVENQKLNYGRAISEIIRKIPNEHIECYLITGKSIIDLSRMNWNYYSSEVESVGNNRLIRLFFEAKHDEYVFLRELSGYSASRIRAFDFPDTEILINLDFNRNVDFVQLLEWLSAEIINLASSEIDFDFEVLVHRYLLDRKLTIDQVIVTLLIDFLSAYLNNIPNLSEVKKLKKLIEQERIIHICSNYISHLDRPVKTPELLKELEGNFIEISRNDLLKLLNNAKSVFTMIGYGTWGLSTWRGEGLIGGSIRDIVISILSKRRSPIHISEILDYFSQYRNLDARSIVTNLKMNQNETFVFLNCGFIGLNNIRYDDKWYSLPSILGPRFSKRELDIVFREHGDIGAYYERIYGYPRIHTEYLIQTKFGNQYI